MSKQSSNFFSTFRNSLRNFEALFELSCENLIPLAKWCSKFRLTFRGLAQFFANGKTIAVLKKQRKFEENSFGSKYRSFSKVFKTFRRNSSKFVLITFAQYCMCISRKRRAVDISWLFALIIAIYLSIPFLVFFLCFAYL